MAVLKSWKRGHVMGSRNYFVYEYKKCNIYCFVNAKLSNLVRNGCKIYCLYLIYEIAVKTICAMSQLISTKWTSLGIKVILTFFRRKCIAGKSSTFLIVFFFWNFSNFLPHFGPPGGQVAHPGRPYTPLDSHLMNLLLNSLSPDSQCEFALYIIGEW